MKLVYPDRIVFAKISQSQCVVSSLKIYLLRLKKTHCVPRAFDPAGSCSSRRTFITATISPTCNFLDCCRLFREIAPGFNRARPEEISTSHFAEERTLVMTQSDVCPPPFFSTRRLRDQGEKASLAWKCDERRSAFALSMPLT